MFFTKYSFELFANVASSNNSSFVTGVFVRVLLIRLIRFHSDNNSDEELQLSKFVAVSFNISFELFISPIDVNAKASIICVLTLKNGVWIFNVGRKFLISVITSNESGFPCIA